MISTDPRRTTALVPGPRSQPVVPRRVARLIPAKSPQWVVLEVVRGAMEPPWAPIDAAHTLLTDVDDLRVLRCARARLRPAPEDRVTLRLARALATLNTAIGLLEHDAEADSHNASHVRVDGGPAT